MVQNVFDIVQFINIMLSVEDYIISRMDIVFQMITGRSSTLVELALVWSSVPVNPAPPQIFPPIENDF